MNSEITDSFTTGSITKMAKVIDEKFGDKAIEILTLLQHEEKLNKGSIAARIKNSQPSVDKWLDSLECTTAIETERIATSYIYAITDVGKKMLQTLKELKKAKGENV